MAKRTARPEMAYDEKTGLYRKRIKDPATGKWIPVYGHTKEETRQKVKQREAELARAVDLREDPPFFQYAAKWYALHAGDYSAKRQLDYRNAINNHIGPHLGPKQLRSITDSDVREVMASLEGTSKSLQQKVVTAMRKIFAAAVADGILDVSPCADLKPGGKEAPEKEALTRTQQQVLLSSLRGCEIFPLVALCLYTGLRREEALGLRWRDVDLEGEAPRLSVRTSCTWKGYNQAELTEVLKSDAAWRTVPLPPPLVEILKALPRPGACVICRPDGTPLTASAFRRRWEQVKIREEHVFRRTMKGKKTEQLLRVGDPVPYRDGVTVSMDFHVTPHLLRHTYISELILGGVPVRRVQYLAGHSSPIQTLRIYSHLMENKPEDLYDEVTKVFPGQNSG